MMAATWGDADRRYVRRRVRPRRQEDQCPVWPRLWAWVRRVVARPASDAERLADAYQRGRADERANWAWLRDELRVTQDAARARARPE